MQVKWDENRMGHKWKTFFLLVCSKNRNTLLCKNTVANTLILNIKGGSNKVINMAQYLVLLWSTVISILLLKFNNLMFLDVCLSNRTARN